MTTMRAAVFEGKGKIAIREVPRPEPGVGEALVKVTLTTICGTDVHILKGEYPVREGLIVGHEPVGVIEALGPGVTGYAPGDRVIVGAITPCGQCRACLSGVAFAVRPRRRRLRGDRRLALRQHHQRLPGRVRAGPERPGQPGEDPGRAHRRGRAALPRHHVDRASRRRSAATCGSATRSRCSRRGRSACARRRARACAGASLVIGVDSVPRRLEFARAHGRGRRPQLQGAGRASPRSSG